MADKAKGIVVEVGGDVSGLSKALKTLNKEVNSTQSELNKVEKLLKLDPTNTVLLQQKQELLAQSISGTQKKLDALKSAQEKADQAMADGTEINQKEYRELQREIITTNTKLEELKNKANQAGNSLDSVDEKPVEEVAEAAKDAEKALDNAGKEASTFGDVLKAEALVEGAKGIVSELRDAAEGSKEYMKIMGSLETSSQAAGYTAEETAQSYKALYGVLGDDQTAATTTANLQALGLEQSKLNELLNLSVGAWASYGDSIPIDGLAESINETVRAGQVTGTFADVLNWGTKEGETFGVTLKENTEANKEWNEAVQNAKTAEDFFNLALQDASSETERANLVMQAMADQGLSKVADGWYKNNAALVENNNANEENQKAMAKLSETVLPVMTKATELTTKFINFILENKDAVIAALIGIGTALAVFKITGLITSLVSGFKTLFGVIKSGQGIMAALNAVIGANPIVLIISAIAGLVAAFVYLWNNCEGFREFWINLWEKVKEVFSNVWDAIVGFFTETIPNAWNGVVEWFSGIPEWWKNLWTQIKDFFVNTWNSIVSFFTETISNAVNGAIGIFQKFDDWLTGIFSTDWSKNFGFFGDILNGFFANISNIWDSIKRVFTGVIDFVKGVFTGDWQRAWNGVKDIFGGIFDGLVAIAKAPLNGIIGLLNGAIGALNKLIGGLNKIKFDVPDWVPAIGGKNFGINIPKIPKIPYLAKGGILSQGSAVVGEAGPELLTMLGNRAMVQPLTQQTKNTNLGGVNIYVYGAPGQNIDDLAEVIMDKFQTAYQRKVEVW